MYILASNGVVQKYPYSVAQLKKDNPNVSFPAFPSTELLAGWGVHFCEILPTPQNYDPLTEELYQQPPVQDEKGKWVIAWGVKSAKISQASLNIREERDRLLAASDWTQVADAPVDQAAWATYRQALRDVPQQAGFPHDVIWPEEPNG